jgi:hypothetical protein
MVKRCQVSNTNEIHPMGEAGSHTYLENLLLVLCGDLALIISDIARRNDSNYGNIGVLNGNKRSSKCLRCTWTGTISPGTHLDE